MFFVIRLSRLFNLYMFFTMFSETLHTLRTHGQTIQGFWVQPPGKPIRIRIKCSWKLYLNGPQQKGNSNRVFQKILTQNIVELLGEGHLLLFSGLWLGTNRGYDNIQQPALPAQASPSSAALPAQPEPGAHHLPVSVHAFAVFFNRIISHFVIQELGAE